MIDFGNDEVDVLSTLSNLYNSGKSQHAQIHGNSKDKRRTRKRCPAAFRSAQAANRIAAKGVG
jgi:hypothetical protein